jgi:ferredoxin
MAIPTSRTREAGTITIDREKCTGCGLCVNVCKDFDLKIEDGKAVVGDEGIFECIACAHCMLICPEGAITISGRHLEADDIQPLPPKEEAATYDSLVALLWRRRSIREFRDRPVPREIIEKVLEAASTSPMGLPPSDVNVLVFDSKEKSFAFAKDYCNYLKSLRWMVTPVGLVFMRMIYGKENADMFRDFIKPLIRVYTDYMDKGENIVTYDAPVVMYFYGSPYVDPADPIIPATYAMLAAESLGLGTCMLGGIHPFIQSGKVARRLREKWGIRYKSKEGLFVIMGYPKVKYHSTVLRTFANVDWTE